MVYAAIYLRIHYGRLRRVQGKKGSKGPERFAVGSSRPEFATRFGPVTFPVGRAHGRFAIRFAGIFVEKSVIVDWWTNNAWPTTQILANSYGYFLFVSLPACGTSNPERKRDAVDAMGGNWLARDENIYLKNLR